MNSENNHSGIKKINLLVSKKSHGKVVDGVLNYNLILRIMEHINR